MAKRKRQKEVELVQGASIRDKKPPHINGGGKKLKKKGFIPPVALLQGGRWMTAVRRGGE